MYATIKMLHIACATLSATGFACRGALMLIDSPLLTKRWLRIVPHVNDTILLTAAIALAVMLGQFPLTHSWLTAKVVGLCVYIGLGTMALGRRYDKRVRALCWLAAMAVFGYIVSVAISKDPYGFLA
jgi:uncharacterized membrane protein SirB2